MDFFAAFAFFSSRTLRFKSLDPAGREKQKLMEKSEEDYYVKTTLADKHVRDKR
jgi:hypothetical protein